MSSVYLLIHLLQKQLNSYRGRRNNFFSTTGSILFASQGSIQFTISTGLLIPLLTLSACSFAYRGILCDRGAFPFW